MPIKDCPHPAKRKTLIGDTACCSMCARFEPLRCERCGADKFELRRRGGGDRVRTVNGRPFCGRCRAELEREAEEREAFYKLGSRYRP